MCEHTRGLLGLMLAWFSKVLREALVGNNSILEESIYFLWNFNNDVSIVSKRGKIVFFHYGLGDVLDRNVNVFVMVQGCVKAIFFRYIVMKQAPGVDIMLLRRKLTVIISVVLVLISLG